MSWPTPTSSYATPENQDAGLPLAKRLSWLRLVHLVSFGGLAAFVVAVVALHGLRGSLNPIEHTISEYSLGSYGWLMRAAFVALGLGVLATAVSLHVRFGPLSWPRRGPLLLVCTAIGLFLDAAYNTDHPRVPESAGGTVHGFGMLIISLTLPAATFILGSTLVRISNPPVRARCLPALGVAQLMAILGFEMSPITSRGLTERIAIAFAVITLFSLRALALSPGDGRVEPQRSLARSGMRSCGLTSVIPVIGNFGHPTESQE